MATDQYVTLWIPLLATSVSKRANPPGPLPSPVELLLQAGRYQSLKAPRSGLT
jgi:hypothetical protein